MTLILQNVAIHKDKQDALKDFPACLAEASLGRINNSECGMGRRRGEKKKKKSC